MLFLPLNREKEWCIIIIIFLLPKFSMKTVDKYQFNEEQPRYDSGIECFLAYHTVLRKHFTLKRINLSGDTDQSLYNYLIKEVSILKKLSHDCIYRCHKMLKTKNNLYLIYDNIEGDPLETLFTQKLPFQTKLQILTQITSVLTQIRKKNLVHLAINSNNIILQQDNKIKVLNFGQAQEFASGQHSILLTQPLKSSLTSYVAPQVFENKAHVNSDVFSLGIIIRKLFDRQIQTEKIRKNEDDSNVSVEARWSQRLQQLVNKMTIKVPEVRISIKQVDTILSAPIEPESLLITRSFKSSKSQRYVGNTTTPRRVNFNKNTSQMPSTHNLSSYSHQKSVSSNSSPKKNLSSADNGLKRTVSQISNDKISEVETLMKKILKKRNFVVALLYMAQACTYNIENKTSTSIILSFLLIKKAAVAISQLAKLLKVGKCADLTIQKKMQQYFFKTSFYLKINPIVNKQMISTQEMLQKITAEVSKLDSFSSNNLLMEEVRQEKMNNSYLRKCAFQFLSYLSLQNTVEYLESYELNHVIGIYLISLLSSFKTYEDAHDTLFSESHVNFEDDPLIKSLIEYKKEVIFQMMEIDLELREQKEDDGLSVAKSTRTIK